MCICTQCQVYTPCTLACMHTHTLSHSCVPVDLVLLGCAVTINCLECGRGNETQGLSYGQPRQLWCRRCHGRLAVGAEQSKFVNHQPGVVLGEECEEIRGEGHCKEYTLREYSCFLPFSHTQPPPLFLLQAPGLARSVTLHCKKANHCPSMAHASIIRRATDG